MPENKDERKLLEIIERGNLSEEQLKLIDKATRQRRPKSVDAGRIYVPRRHVRLGFVGDTHLNSKTDNVPFLDALYREFKAAGVDYVIQTGDLTDGEHMHAGHEYEIKEHGIDAVIDYVINEYPHHGLKTRFIAGNHDESYMKRSGADICRLVAEKRHDMEYLGMNRGTINIGTAKAPTLLKVLHPGGGSAKALSYKSQKIVEEITPEEKPHILVMGHYHKFDYIFYRNIHVFQAGTAQTQSAWMERNNLQAHLAAWLVDIYFRPDGTVDRIEQQELWEDKLL